jgi:hypothetical protein
MKKYICPKCGGRYDRPYCGECGEPIMLSSSTIVEEPTQEEIKQKNASMSVIIAQQNSAMRKRKTIIIALILVIISLLIFIILNHSKGDESSESSSEAVGAYADSSSESEDYDYKDSDLDVTTTTTPAPQRPTYKKGEEIWIKGYISDYSDKKLVVTDNDGLEWNINCENIGDFDKLFGLSYMIDVTVWGNVINSNSVKFSKIEIDGTKYNIDSFDYGKQNCLQDAKSYLTALSGMSEKSLKKQLEYEKYTKEQINYALKHCGANWKEQALKAAKSYLKSLSLSREELIAQLKYEGFNDEQINYAMSKIGY